VKKYFFFIQAKSMDLMAKGVGNHQSEDSLAKQCKKSITSSSQKPQKLKDVKPKSKKCFKCKKKLGLTG
jgi:hypothetical protein